MTEKEMEYVRQLLKETAYEAAEAATAKQKQAEKKKIAGVSAAIDERIKKYEKG